MSWWHDPFPVRSSLQSFSRVSKLFRFLFTITYNDLNGILEVVKYVVEGVGLFCAFLVIFQ